MTVHQNVNSWESFADCARIVVGILNKFSFSVTGSTNHLDFTLASLQSKSVE